MEVKGGVREGSEQRGQENPRGAEGWRGHDRDQGKKRAGGDMTETRHRKRTWRTSEGHRKLRGV